jgi:myosin regulatory light chain 12
MVSPRPPLSLRSKLIIEASKSSSLGRGLPPGVKKGPHAREASGAAYTMFSTDQVKQFKEAFNMIDQDGDGRVTEEDLKVMLSNLGE